MYLCSIYSSISKIVALQLGAGCSFNLDRRVDVFVTNINNFLLYHRRSAEAEVRGETKQTRAEYEAKLKPEEELDTKAKTKRAQQGTRKTKQSKIRRYEGETKQAQRT